MCSLIVPERARPLLALLFDDLEPDERINLRGLRGGVAWNRFARNVDEALAVSRELLGRPGTDVLLGVLPRRGEDGTAGGLRRGTCLWVDLDLPHEADSATAAWHRLARFAVRPSAVVHSGRGLHAYWRLRESVPLEGLTARHGFGDALRALALALGGDRAATDAARVLRLPGSLNHKYDPPRPVSVLAIDQTHRVALDELTAALPPVPPRTEPVDASPIPSPSTAEDRWVSRLLIEGAPRGQRNAACARLAGYLLSRTLPPDVVTAIVLSFAARCRPPLPPAEAEQVVRSIARYRPRPVADRDGPAPTR